MGIKDLNNIVKQTPVSTRDLPSIDNIVIDGSNMIITYLNRASSDLRKLAPKSIFETVNRDMFYQMKYIVSATTNRAVSVISQWISVYEPDSVKVVLDPKNTVNYILSDDMVLSENSKRILLNNNKKCEFELKSEEQEARKNANSKKDELFKKYTELLEEYDEKTSDMYRQSFHYSEACNLFSLGRIVIYNTIHELNALFPGKVRLVNAIDEADLVIKNIGEELSELGTVLICSEDTDYFVLFSNNPNVFITSVRSNGSVYSPLIQWRNAFTIINDDNSETQLIQDEDIYEYTIRLAPLFGNDYNRDMIISAKVYENALKIFYPSLFEIRSARSSIDKLLKSMRKRYPKDGVIDHEAFDDIIVEHLRNKEANSKRYLFSVSVYRNYSFFNKYESVEYKDLPKIDDAMMELFDKWFSRPDPENKYTLQDLIVAGKYHAFYSWDTTGDDFQNPAVIERDVKKMLSYYKSIEIDLPLTTVGYSRVSEETDVRAQQYASTVRTQRLCRCEDGQSPPTAHSTKDLLDELLADD